MPEVNKKKTNAEILRRAQETLETAKFGLEVFKSNLERRMAGLRNLVVFGRAVTNVLQNLRSTESDFDEWYALFKEEMKRDPLMRYFYELRSTILKEGNLEVGKYVHIKSFRYPEDLKKMGFPPPNAKAFFIGDNLGGSGWEVEQDDKSRIKFYVDLPVDIGKVGFIFPNAPNYHLGEKLDTDDIEVLGGRYIRYLEDLVEKARMKFG